jgi:hypothetical protein
VRLAFRDWVRRTVQEIVSHLPFVGRNIPEPEPEPYYEEPEPPETQGDYFGEAGPTEEYEPPKYGGGRGITEDDLLRDYLSGDYYDPNTGERITDQAAQLELYVREEIDYQAQELGYGPADRYDLQSLLTTGWFANVDTEDRVAAREQLLAILEWGDLEKNDFDWDAWREWYGETA